MAAIPPSRLRRLHDRAAQTFARADFLHQHVRAELLSRLDFVTLQPERVLDLGAGPGAAFGPLRDRFPDARLLGLDHAPEMLRIAPTDLALRLCGDAHCLPLPDASVDLVFANLLLAYCPDPVPVLAEVQRVLRSPGLFMFTSLGPDTLVELRDAWTAADSHSHVVRFPDMHDLGDLIVHAGLAEPVLDRELLCVTYADVARLRDDLRAVGSINRSAGRNPGLTGRAAGQRFRDALDGRRDAQGRLALTVELVYGQAWAGAADGRGDSQEISFPADQIRRRRD